MIVCKSYGLWKPNCLARKKRQQQQRGAVQPTSRLGAFQALQKKKKTAEIRCAQYLPHAIRWEIELKSVKCRSNGVDLHIFLFHSISSFSRFGRIGISMHSNRRNVLSNAMNGKRFANKNIHIVNAKCTFC